MTGVRPWVWAFSSSLTTLPLAGLRLPTLDLALHRGFLVVCSEEWAQNVPEPPIMQRAHSGRACMPLLD